MSCGYFRVFLTLLAAFGPFFGYVCRLNLGLIIEDMVVKAGPPLTGEPSRPATPSGAELTRSLSRGSFFTEEHAVAELAAANWWLKQRSLLQKVKLRPAHHMRNNSRAANSVHSLSFTLDVSDGQRGQQADLGTNRSAPGAGAPPTSVEPDTNSGSDSGSPRQVQPVSDSVEIVAEAPLLRWNEEDKSLLLGAFFLGYVIFQVPAGRLAEIFGAKLLLIWLGVGTGFSSLVFPYAARFTEGNIWFPYAIRVLMGASQAGLFPASYVLLCHWLPNNERSSWLPVPSAMGRFGTIAMNLVVPLLMRAYNWEWVFYVSGLVTLAWTLLIVVFGSDKPTKSWWISKEELIYIESRKERPTSVLATSSEAPTQSIEPPPKGTLAGLSAAELDGSTLTLDGKRPLAVAKPSIDWLKLLSNRALLVLTIVMFSSEWSNMLLLIKLSSFLMNAFSMDLNEVAIWSSVLVFIYCVGYPLSGVIASQLETRRVFGLNSLRIRKLFEAAAQALQAAGCLVIAFWDDKPVVLCALVAMMVGRSLVGGGQCLMPPELSRDYPGTVLAVSNTIANSAGWFGPPLVTWLVGEDTTRYSSWRNLWLLSAALFTLAGLLFCWLADNRPQNYCKRPKLKRSQTTSLANLVLPNLEPPTQQASDATKRGGGGGGGPIGQTKVPAEAITMSSFGRVSSEPQPSRAQRSDQLRQQ